MASGRQSCQICNDNAMVEREVMREGGINLQTMLLLTTPNARNFSLNGFQHVKVSTASSCEFLLFVGSLHHIRLCFFILPHFTFACEQWQVNLLRVYRTTPPWSSREFPFELKQQTSEVCCAGRNTFYTFPSRANMFQVLTIFDMTFDSFACSEQERQQQLTAIHYVTLARVRRKYTTIKLTFL